jgi:hypothetical protein
MLLKSLNIYGIYCTPRHASAECLVVVARRRTPTTTTTTTSLLMAFGPEKTICDTPRQIAREAIYEPWNTTPP